MSFLRRFITCLALIAVSNIAMSAKHVADKKSAIVIDYTNGKKVLYSEKADSKRYPASLTKMMTLYLLFDAIKHKKITLNTKFKVSKYATTQCPSKLGLKVGSKISVSDVIKALLVKSANDVAVVAAEGLSGNVQNFCKLMNQKAKKLGMKNTHFENPSGLPNAKQTSTARDIAKLGMALYRDFPQYHHFFALKNFTYEKANYNTHCKILRWYKGADGAKTGYINASGFNLLVTANRYNKSGHPKRLFVVVMGRETARSRDIYAGQLMDRYFAEHTIASQITKSKTAKKSLMAQVSKSEMLDEVVHADEEIFISKENFNAMLDDLYKDDEEESLAALDEILVTPKKAKNRKRH